MTMFIDMYINLYRMVTMYCWDTVDKKFDVVTDELELSLIHISEPTRPNDTSRMPSSA